MSIQLGRTEETNDAGTLLWIGDRDRLAFRDAYRFCEANVSQLAYRAGLEQAIRRGATDVKTIVFPLVNDSARNCDAMRSIRARHPNAESVLLLGPLCAGARPSPSQRHDVPAIDWHTWESALPQFLHACGVLPTRRKRPQSIAVVSPSFDAAASLLEIAGQGGATTTWCRARQLSRISRFDEIWFDDSQILNCDWPAQIERLRVCCERIVWISNSVTPDSKNAALDAGVDLVIAKPGDYSILIDRVATPSHHCERQAA